MAPTVAKLPPEKIGKSFLAASHYRVGMDDAFLEVAQISFSTVRLNAKLLSFFFDKADAR